MALSFPMSSGAGAMHLRGRRIDQRECGAAVVVSDGAESVRLAALDLCNRYAVYLDSYRTEMLLELFTPDARLHLPGGSYSGTDELRAFFASRDSTRGDRHIIDNQVTDVIDENRAVGECCIALYRSSGPVLEDGSYLMVGPTVVGTYFDEYVRTDGTWRIAERTMKRALVTSPPSAPLADGGARR